MNSENFEPDRFWHATMGSVGGHVLYRDESSVRRAVRSLARVAPAELLTFGLVDTHDHRQTCEGRARAGRVTRSFQQALAGSVEASLLPTHFEPIRDARHAFNTACYTLRQAARHDLPVHPALWSGSSFLDLAGARWIPGLRLQLATWLPRFRLRVVFPELGLPAEPIPVLSDHEIRMLGAARIVDAAAAATCADPALPGKSAETVAAKRASAVLARGVGMSTGDVAAAIRAGCSTIRRLAAEGADPRLLAAVRRRLGLEQLAAGSSTGRGSRAPDQPRW